MYDLEYTPEEIRLSEALERSQKETDSLKSRLELLQDEVNNNRHELFHMTAYIGQLEQWIKSDSVYTLLRYGYKNPSSSGVDDLEDKSYLELYHLCRKLQEADHQENEFRKDSFDQTLP